VRGPADDLRRARLAERYGPRSHPAEAGVKRDLLARDRPEDRAPGATAAVEEPSELRRLLGRSGGDEDPEDSLVAPDGAARLVLNFPADTDQIGVESDDGLAMPV